VSTKSNTISTVPAEECFLHIKITPEENSIFNWCRYRHRPAKMNAWVRETLLREALKMVAEANASGKDAPQGINELLDGLRTGFKT
jgi:hypothetical protein